MLLRMYTMRLPSLILPPRAHMMHSMGTAPHYGWMQNVHATVLPAMLTRFTSALCGLNLDAGVCTAMSQLPAHAVLVPATTLMLQAI